MKVILQQSVPKLGHPGDVVEVKDGYARNFLVPRGLAVKASPSMVRHAESLKRSHQSKMGKVKVEAQVTATKLAGSPVVVHERAGEEGKLFGSVTATEVAAALAAQFGVVVDRRDVHLDHPIRSLGTHEARVHLHEGVDPVVTIEVRPVEA